MLTQLKLIRKYYGNGKQLTQANATEVPDSEQISNFNVHKYQCFLRTLLGVRTASLRLHKMVSENRTTGRITKTGFTLQAKLKQLKGNDLHL